MNHDSSIFSLDRLALIFSGAYVTHLVRYLALAGPVFIVFYVWRKRWKWLPKIQGDLATRADMRREFLWSLSSIGVFSLTAVGVYVMTRLGWNQLYFRIEPRGWGYLVFSTIVLIVAHDAYFYWTHRWMHAPRLFPIFHRIHHLSRTPTPLAAFSFHPLEALVQAGIFPIMSVIMPLHPLAAMVWLLYMTVMNVMGHCGFEPLPAGYARHPIFKWFNTTTHHDQHHRVVRSNFSLYFNFWDRVMRTNHETYEDEFDRVRPPAKTAAAPAPGTPAVLAREVA
jgi:sterol desaturase/sphingolipid hydroxylase (fatty acid hydroxylase superfamily)